MLNTHINTKYIYYICLAENRVIRVMISRNPLVRLELGYDTKYDTNDTKITEEKIT